MKCSAQMRQRITWTHVTIHSTTPESSSCASIRLCMYLNKKKNSRVVRSVLNVRHVVHVIMCELQCVYISVQGMQPWYTNGQPIEPDMSSG